MDNMENILRHEKYFLYQVGLKYYMIGNNLCACVSPGQMLLVAYYKYKEREERYDNLFQCPICVFAYKDVINRLKFVYEKGEYKSCEYEKVFSKEEKAEIKKQYTDLIEFEKQYEKNIN